MLSLIVARDRNGAIGKGGDIPWRAPEDLKFFQRETLGGALIMGRKTWESLPFKPLKNRDNIVVSSRDVDGAETCRSIEAAIEHARDLGQARVYGMGGAQIYSAMMPHAQRLLITEVDTIVDDADTWFPPFEMSEWELVGRIKLRPEGPRCVLHEYLRRDPK